MKKTTKRVDPSFLEGKEYIRGGLFVLGWLLILGAAGGTDCGTLGFGAASAVALCGLGLMAGATIAERRKDR